MWRKHSLCLTIMICVCRCGGSNWTEQEKSCVQRKMEVSQHILEENVFHSRSQGNQMWKFMVIKFFIHTESSMGLLFLLTQPRRSCFEAGIPKSLSNSCLILPGIRSHDERDQPQGRLEGEHSKFSGTHQLFQNLAS